jgi:hypothetical protein
VQVTATIRAQMFTGFFDSKSLNESAGFKRFDRSEAVERLEELELAATLLRDIPDMTGQIVAVGAWHCFS